MLRKTLLPFLLLCAACAGSKLPNPPAAPKGVTAASGDGQVAITWEAAAGATGYTLFWSNAQGVSGTPIEGVASGFLHTGLANGATYYYRVRAFNADGDSEPSAQASAVPQVAAPGAPASLAVTSGVRKLTVAWAPVSGAERYNLYWSTTPGVGTQSSRVVGVTSPHDLGGLAPGAVHYLKVSAVNAAGEVLSAEAHGQTLLAPPAHVGASAVSATGVTLAWDAVANASAGYTVYWKAGPGVEATDHPTAVASGTSLAVSGLAPEAHYFFRVAASDGAVGEPSAELEAVTEPVRVAPQLIEALKASVASHLDGIAGLSKQLASIPLITAFLPACAAGTTCTGLPSFDLDANIADAKAWLAANLLNLAFVESDTHGVVVLRIDPAKACRAAVEAPNAICVNVLTKLPLRLSLMDAGAGAQYVEVHTGELHPFDFEVSPDHLSVSVDLPRGWATAQAVMDLTGTPPPEISVMTGALSLNVHKLGPKHFSFSLDLPSAARVTTSRPQYADYVDLALGVAHGAVTAEVDADAGAAGIGLGLGSVDLAIATQLLLPAPAGHLPWTSNLFVHGAALDLSATAAFGSPDLTLGKLTFGSQPLLVYYDGAPVISLDLNKDDGRVVSGKVTGLGGGGKVPLLTFEKVHDLGLAWNLLALAPLFGLPTGPPIDSILQGSLHARLDGDPKPALELAALADPATYCASTDALSPDSLLVLLKTVRGVFHIQADDLEPVDVPAGSYTEVRKPFDGENVTNLLGLVTAAMCKPL
jgi:hypothetical protein